jgi:hypothetical protein
MNTKLAVFFLCVLVCQAAIQFQGPNGTLAWPGLQLSQTDATTLTLTGTFSVTQTVHVGGTQLFATGKIPNQLLGGASYNQDEIAAWLIALQFMFSGAATLLTVHIHTLTLLPVNAAYLGGVFSPFTNRVYFVPKLQADGAGKNWHYLDCTTGNVVTYIHTLTLLPVNNAYVGGVYAPVSNRIYFVPYGQADEAGKNWHYLDCTTGNVVTYIHTLTLLPVDQAYQGGVYAPVSNRIYFVPRGQVGEAGKNWHYLADDSGVSVPRGVALPSNL